MNHIQKLSLIVLVLGLLSGVAFAQEDMQNVSVQQLKSILDKKQGNIVLLDVRTEDEYAKGYIQGAINYNCLTEKFADNIKSLDKSKTYYVYCYSGMRSERAVLQMKELGFTNLFNVTLGIKAWTDAGYDIKND